jgi:hypothetical protein
VITIAIPTGTKINSITLCAVSYESSLFKANNVDNIYFLDTLVSSSASGSLTDAASAFSNLDESTVFTGMSSLGFSDSAQVTYSVAMTGKNFVVTQASLSAWSSGFIWYRMRTCGNNYYLDPDSALCVQCHYSCLTCKN